MQYAVRGLRSRSYLIAGMHVYVTHSRKRGPFPQKSDCELDLSVDSAKSVVHTRENRLMLAHSVPKLQSFEYHTRAYLGFEILAFISVCRRSQVPYWLN